MTICPPLVLLLLIGVCLPANAQDTPPVAPVQQALLPNIERHRTPDYVAPDTKPVSRLRKFKRLKMTGEYALSVGPKQAAPLTRPAESGMPFWITSDGRRVLINRLGREGNSGESSLREPLFRQGLFGGFRRNDSFHSIP